MSDFVDLFVNFIKIAVVFFVVFKVGKIALNALKSISSGNPLFPINENQLAITTKAKFESLNELEVLRFVMDTTGWTLAKSKAFCDKIKPKNADIPKSNPANNLPQQSPITKKHISKEELEIIVREKLNSIGKLETITYIINSTGWTLKDSKSFCDQIENALNIENQFSSANSSKSNSIDESDQIKYIMEKSGWNQEKAKAYLENIKSYQKESQKTYNTK